MLYTAFTTLLVHWYTLYDDALSSDMHFVFSHIRTGALIYWGIIQTRQDVGWLGGDQNTQQYICVSGNHPLPTYIHAALPIT